MAAWMHSPGHRANILQPAYREIGFGVIAGNPAAHDGTGATFVTEFGVVERSARLALSASTGARRAAAQDARSKRVRRPPPARPACAPAAARIALAPAPPPAPPPRRRAAVASVHAGLN